MSPDTETLVPRNQPSDEPIQGPMSMQRTFVSFLAGEMPGVYCRSARKRDATRRRNGVGTEDEMSSRIIANVAGYPLSPPCSACER